MNSKPSYHIPKPFKKIAFEECAHVNWVCAGRTTPEGGFDIDYQRVDNLEVFCKDCETFLNISTKEKLDDPRLTTFRQHMIDNYKFDMEGG